MKQRIELIINILSILLIIVLAITNYSFSKDIKSIKSTIKTLKSEKGQMKYIVSSYFDPNDRKKNSKYCLNQKDNRLNTARFTKEGEFIECFNW